MLEDLGYEVEWRPVTPGEDLSTYSLAIAILNKPNSIAASYFYGALWTLWTFPGAIAALDDWQTVELVSGIETYARSRERAFKLHGANLDERLKDRLMEFMTAMAHDRWEFPIVAWALGLGDITKLGIPGAITRIDPTAYTYRYAPTGGTRGKTWVHASLLNVTVPKGLTWPVYELGPQDRGANGIGPAGVNARPRMTEPELAKFLRGSWGMFSPVHPHSGSGWWRARYLLAADAGCILSADPAEAACLGQPYIDASDPLAVELMSVHDLWHLARMQNECLNDTAWTKAKVRAALKKLIGDSQMARLTFTKPNAPVAAPTPAPVKTSAKPLPRAATASRTVTSLPLKNAGEGSGAYMRRMMVDGFTDPDTLLAAVLAQYPGSKATKSDVSFNKNKLKNDGVVITGGSKVVAAPSPPVEKTAKYVPTPPWDTQKEKSSAKVRKEPEADLTYATIRGKVWALRHRVDKKTVDALVAIATCVIDQLEKLEG